MSAAISKLVVLPFHMEMRPEYFLFQNSSQPVASSLERVSPEIGSPNPLPASLNDGPGHGQTARQPS